MIGGSAGPDADWSGRGSRPSRPPPIRAGVPTAVNPRPSRDWRVRSIHAITMPQRRACRQPPRRSIPGGRRRTKAGSRSQVAAAGSRLSSLLPVPRRHTRDQDQPSEHGRFVAMHRAVERGPLGPPSAADDRQARARRDYTPPPGAAGQPAGRRRRRRRPIATTQVGQPFQGRDARMHAHAFDQAGHRAYGHGRVQPATVHPAFAELPRRSTAADRTGTGQLPNPRVSAAATRTPRGCTRRPGTTRQRASRQENAT